MTAKEKAIEIAKQYWLAMGSQNYPTAIKCAIIHVKGIIEVLDSIPTTRDHFNKTVYFEQVLDELNQM